MPGETANEPGGIRTGLCNGPGCWHGDAVQIAEATLTVAGDLSMALGTAAMLGVMKGAVAAAEMAGPSSRVLGAALENAGFVRGAGEAAHHIVAGGANAAAPARQVLARFGIGINEAANGVFLPGTLAAENATGAAVHSTIHTAEYYRAVNAALGGATSREGALLILNDIAESLRTGGFP